MTWGLMVQQLSVSVKVTEPSAPRFNPHPPGQIQPGSATAAVLELLRLHPERWFTRAQIIFGTGRSQRSVDWAVAFLIQQGHVRAVQDASRNPRWKRYRYAGK